MKGWIKLHRALLTNELWVKEPFTKGQAWVDILLRINHKDNKVLVGNQSIEILKGQTLWSMKDMASRWRWSRKKVGNFLKMLKKEHQIDYKSTTKYTVITVINWELYQNEIQEGTSNIDEKNIKRTSKEHQKNTNKNDKNVKNENKNIYSDIFNLYLEQEIIKHKELTGTMKKAIDKATKKFSVDEIKLAITRYGTMYRDKKNIYAKDYCKYKWTLQELLTREKGISEFLDEGGKWIRYTDKQQVNKTSASNNQNNNAGWNGYKKFE